MPGNKGSLNSVAGGTMPAEVGRVASWMKREVTSILQGRADFLKCIMGALALGPCFLYKG